MVGIGSGLVPVCVRHNMGLDGACRRVSFPRHCLWGCSCPCRSLRALSTSFYVTFQQRVMHGVQVDYAIHTILRAIVSNFTKVFCYFVFINSGTHGGASTRPWPFVSQCPHCSTRCRSG